MVIDVSQSACHANDDRCRCGNVLWPRIKIGFHGGHRSTVAALATRKRDATLVFVFFSVSLCSLPQLMTAADGAIENSVHTTR